MDRRKFIKASAMTAAALSVSDIASSCCSEGKKKPAVKIPELKQTVEAPVGDIRSMYIELGHNMWCDWPTEQMGSSLEEGAALLQEGSRPDLKLQCKDEYWKEVTDYMAQKGVNMIVVDLGEGLYYPSHPELAIEGTWSIEKMQAEIRRLNALGVEVIPKLNFSATHNGWMKDYRHMVCSQPYYRMCEDVIADVMATFGYPRYFHIGFDEEVPMYQEKIFGRSYVCARLGEMWMHDFLHIVRTVESHGARPWVWSDYGWAHPEYYTRCPKSVVQVNWYYDEQYGGFDPETNNTSDHERLVAFWDLEKHGFDQVPCGTNWVGSGRLALKINADDVIGKLVNLCREIVSKDHLMGFMMAPWEGCFSPETVEIQKKGTDLFIEALQKK